MGKMEERTPPTPFLFRSSSSELRSADLDRPPPPPVLEDDLAVLPLRVVLLPLPAAPEPDDFVRFAVGLLPLPLPFVLDFVPFGLMSRLDVSVAAKGFKREESGFWRCCDTAGGDRSRAAVGEPAAPSDFLLLLPRPKKSIPLYRPSLSVLFYCSSRFPIFSSPLILFSSLAKNQKFDPIHAKALTSLGTCLSFSLVAVSEKGIKETENLLIK